MYLLFETLTLILLAFSHLFININSLFIIFAIRSVVMLLNEEVKVLSSAKIVNLKKLELFGKSLMKIKKKVKGQLSIPEGHHNQSINAQKFCD